MSRPVGMTVVGESFGPYRLEALLGRGGMGEVYRAVDVQQGDRVVALKVLAPALSADPTFQARFRREADIAARIPEPHIVPVHGYGQIEGRLFLEMQLIDGRELGDVLACDGPLAPGRAVALVEQVAGGLDAAHAEGLVHRDVKPANIVVTDPGGGRPEFAYLVDFGIARATEATGRTGLTRTGAIVGTLSYMAPERFLDQPAGPPADVYALACVLYETLTGERPYPGSEPAAQIFAHVQGPIPRPSKRRAGLPPGLDAVVAAGMAKHPGERYRSAGALAAAARVALAGGSAPLPAQAAPTRALPEPGVGAALPPLGPGRAGVAPPGPDRSGATRRRWRVAAVALAAVGLLVAGAVVVDGMDGADPRPATGPATGLPSGLPITDRTLPGQASVGELMVAELGGTPVLIAGGGVLSTGELIDLATGMPICPPIGTPFSAALAVTATVLNGRAVTITGGVDGIVRTWDTATGTALPRTLVGHTTVVNHVAVAEIEGRPVVVASADDGSIRRWGLADGEPIGQPIAGPTQAFTLSVARAGTRQVIIATAVDVPFGTARLFDLASGAELATPLAGLLSGKTTVAQLDGRPVIVDIDAGRFGPKRVALYDLDTGAAVATRSLPSGSTAAAAAVVRGRGVLALVRDNAVELQDLVTGVPLGVPLVHPEPPRYVVIATPDRGPVLLSSSLIGYTVHVWDLASRVPG